MAKQFPYIGNSEIEQEAILEYLGIKSAEDLFVDIPKEYRDSNLSEIPSSISEMQLVEHLTLLSEKNINPNPSKSFIGQIDEVRIYNRALSYEDVSTLYTSY